MKDRNSFTCSLWILGVAMLWLLQGTVCSASLVFLDGKHKVSFQFPNFADAEMPNFIDYSNNGFSQKIVRDDIWQTITLESSLSELTTKAPFPVSKGSIPHEYGVFLKESKLIQSDHHLIDSLREALIERYQPKTVADLVRTYITYAKENVAYDLSVPQDALSALESGKGSCVGISCLVIALLRTSGIPARYALGYNPPGFSWGAKEEVFGVTQTGGGFHMWLEAFYPDQGWVFSDPANSLNHVDIYHWVIEVGEDEKVNPKYLKRIGDAMKAARTSIEPINETKDIRVLGVCKGLPSRSNLYARRTPSDTIEYVGTLTVTVYNAANKKTLSDSRLHYFKDKKSYYIHEADRNGVITLPILEPGTHYIACAAKGYSQSGKMPIIIAPGRTTSKDVYLEAGGDIACYVVDEKNRPVSKGRIVIWQGRSGKSYHLKKDGTYTFEGKKPGKYQISVQKKGYIEKRYRVQVKAGQKRRLKITLERLGS